MTEILKQVILLEKCPYEEGVREKQESLESKGKLQDEIMEALEEEP